LSTTETITRDELAVITRPDGRVYRPRKIVACAVADD
jgi:hypothetical protein